VAGGRASVEGFSAAATARATLAAYEGLLAARNAPAAKVFDGR
jgi:hypothetical protein